MAQEILPVWDLSDLYSSPNDKAIQGDLRAALQRARRFQSRYRGKLSKIARSPKRLVVALSEFEDILQLAVLPIEYSYLLFSENGIDAARGALLQNCREHYMVVSRELAFFELELLNQPIKVLQRAVRNSALTRFKNFLVKLIASKPHRLSEKEEVILQEKRVTSADAFTRLFDEEFAAKRFRFKTRRGQQELSEAEVLDLLRRPERSVRRAAADSLTLGLKEESRRITFIFNTVLNDKAIEDRFARFKRPEDSRHLNNQISAKAVSTMVDAVVATTDIVGRYYKLKKRLMGVEELFDYDRYAPIPSKSRATVSFREARDIIISACEKFSPQYAEIVNEFFARRWIHAAPMRGKRSGAFCTFVTADKHPYILVNFSGSFREVMTLAHELGHGVHAYLMRTQGYINFGTPLTIAETASVFGEMLVFNHLKSIITDKQELVALSCAKIEEMFATVYRQVSMHRFEQDVHATRRTTGELSTAQYSEIWMRYQREMFKGSVNLREDYSGWWGYISHFVHTPFYVYAYAFGELLTIALYAQYRTAVSQRHEQEFVKKYLAMLSYGDSKSPVDLLRPFHVNLESRRFWMDGIEIVRRMVSEVERLAR